MGKRVTKLSGLEWTKKRAFFKTVMHNDEGHFIGIPHNMWNFVTEEVRAFHERLVVQVIR